MIKLLDPKRSLILALPLLLLLVLNLWPQAGTGSVGGSVRDQTGAVIPGATVILKNVATNITLKTTTNEAGMYMFPGINPGRYDLTVEAPGMQKFEGSLTVQVQQSAIVDVALKVGLATTQVTVSDVTPLLTVDSPTLGHVLERDRIEQLPLNGRSVSSLLVTVPGVETVNSSIRAYGQKTGSGDMLLDGAAIGDRYWGYTTIRRPPGLDTIQEFKIETSNSSAKYMVPTTMILSTKSGTNELHGAAFETARNNAFGVARQRQEVWSTAPKLIRNEFGASSGGPVYIPKIYNGKNKTFWFFAYEAQRIRNESYWTGSVPTTAMRNGDFRDLIDSRGRLYAVYDPWTTDPVTWSRQQISYNGQLNVIDPARISPLAKQLFAITPKENYNPQGVPNYALLGSNWRGNAAGYQDSWTITGRIDHRITDNDRLFARFTKGDEHVFSQDWNLPMNADPSSPLNNVAGSVQRRGPNKSLVLSYVRTFSPTLFNEVLATASNDLRWKGTGALGVKYADLMNLPNPLNVPGWPGIYDCGLSGYYFETDNTQGEPFTYFVVDDNVTKMYRKHEFQFGGHWRADRLNVLPDQQQPQGNHSFASLGTSLYDTSTSRLAPTALAYTGSNLANMFLGVMTYSNQFVRGYYYARGRNYAFYFQDNYKVTPRLTLNLGVRWEYTPAYREKNGFMVGFDKVQKAIVFGTPTIEEAYRIGMTLPVIVQKYQSLGAKFETYKEAGLPRELMYDNRKDFGPRIGMAYRVGDGARSFVVRSGFRMAYFPLPVRSWGVTMRSNTPTTARFYGNSYNNAARSPDGIQNYMMRSVPTVIAGLNSRNVVNLNDPVSVASLTRGSTSNLYFDPHQPTSVTRDWNFTVEKEIMQNTVARVAYVGNQGRNLSQTISENAAMASFVWYWTTRNPLPTGEYSGVATRSFDQKVYGSITRYARKGYSNYNGFQLELERRYTKGYGFQIFYVMGNNFTCTNMAELSGSIPETNQFLPGEVPIDEDAMNRFLNYGRDTSIPKHRVRWNWIVDLPFGRGKPLLGNAGGILDRIVGGWQVAGIGSLQRGWVSLSTSYWPSKGSGKLEIYKYKYPIQNCTSGTCYPGYLYWNGYLPADRINSYDPVTGKPNGYMGVPANYEPYFAPLWPWPKTYDKNDPFYVNGWYGGNNVWIPLNNGTIQRIAWGGLNPMRNCYFQGNITWNLDASLYKRVSITERFALRLQGDFFNVFNHPNNPGPSGSTGILSTSSSGSSARQVQITARLIW